MNLMHVFVKWQMTFFDHGFDIAHQSVLRFRFCLLILQELVGPGDKFGHLCELCVVLRDDTWHVERLQYPLHLQLDFDHPLLCVSGGFCHFFARVDELDLRIFDPLIPVLEHVCCLVLLLVE